MANFTWTPNKVKPSTPKYNVLRTPSESLKRRYYEIDSNEEKFYTLEFGLIQKSGAINGNNRDDIRAHFDANKGFYTSFSWTGVPSYISASPVTCRYETYEEDPDANGNVWKVTITFREEI